MAQTLMNKPETEEDYFNIDWQTRQIAIPEDITCIGVYNDKDTNRIYFRCPVEYGDCRVADYGLRVNYVNTGQSGQEYDGDVYLIDDAEVDGDYMTFSWLVGRRAYLEAGSTAFIVCCKIVDADGNIQNELNTTVMRLSVLEGLEIETDGWTDEYPDLLEEVLQKVDEALDANKNAITGINVNGEAAKITDHVAELTVSGGGVYYGAQDGTSDPFDIKADGVTELYAGLTILIWCDTMAQDAPQLNVNGLGANPIFLTNGTASEGNPFKTSGDIELLFTYDGDCWSPVGIPDTYFYECDTARGTETKSITTDGFILHKGVQVTVLFNNANTADAPRLNIGRLGAYPIIGKTTWNAGEYVTFVFDGYNWVTNNTAEITVGASDVVRGTVEAGESFQFGGDGIIASFCDAQGNANVFSLLDHYAVPLHQDGSTWVVYNDGIYTATNEKGLGFDYMLIGATTLE